MTSAEEWDLAVSQEADLAVQDAGRDGTHRKELEPLVVEAMAAQIQSGDIERPGLEGDVKRSLDRLDQQRRATTDDFLHLVDALNDDTILGSDDPWLDQYAVVGTGLGLRKANRHLSIDDIHSMAEYRRKRMREVSDAYHEFADAEEALRDAMRARGAVFIGDLWAVA